MLIEQTYVEKIMLKKQELVKCLKQFYWWKISTSSVCLKYYNIMTGT